MTLRFGFRLPKNMFPVKFRNANYLFLYTLGAGAIGSLVGATVSGKNSVHMMTDIYSRGAKPKFTEYQEIVDVHAPVADSDTLTHNRRRMAIKDHQLRKAADQAVSAGFQGGRAF